MAKGYSFAKLLYKLNGFKYKLIAVIAVLALAGVMGTAGAISSTSTGCTSLVGGTTVSLNPVVCSICSIFSTLVLIVFILGLLLLVAGGAIYAITHIIPGQTRGAAQGYAMGMIIGGIVGIILVVLAPFILNTIAGASPTIQNALIASGIPVTGGTTSQVSAICTSANYGHTI